MDAIKVIDAVENKGGWISMGMARALVLWAEGKSIRKSAKLAGVSPRGLQDAATRHGELVGRIRPSVVTK